MTVFAFKITLLEPTLVIMLGSGDANQLDSYDFIPGSVIRSALAGQFIRNREQAAANQGKSYNAAQDTECRTLFFSNRVRYLNAYPIARDDQPTLPVPRTWYAEKKDLAEFALKDRENFRVVDFSHVTTPDLDEPKPVRQPFCHLSSAGAVTAGFVSTKKRVMVHNARSTRRVVAEEAGTVFQYQALAQGQSFAGFIVLDEEISSWSDVKEILFRPGLSLGKSRSAGYGQIQVEELDLSGSEQRHWLQIEPPELNEVLALDDDLVVITLLSDALVRDDRGNFTADISHALKIAPTALRRDRSVIQTRVVGGFNRKWGLQIPQSLAVQMGSVFVYERKDIDATVLRAAQTRGLGERCNEGYGQIAINWHRYNQLTGMKATPSPSEADDITLDAGGHGETLARRILTYQLRQQLDTMLLNQVTGLKINPTTTRTQLARVRLMARRALAHPDTRDGIIQEIRQFLDDVKNKPAQQMLEQARVGRKSLYAWLESHCRVGQIKDTFGWGDHHASQLANLSATFTPELQIEYTARLIEGVVKREIDRQRVEEVNDAKR